MSVEIGLRLTAGSVSAHVRTESWASRAVYALSIALAAVVLTATSASLLFPEVLRGPAVGIGQLQGTALVLLVVTLPILVIAMALFARGTTVAVVFWLGAIASIAYQSVLFLFATPFNSLFFLYVAMLALAVWTLLALAWRMPIELLGKQIGVHAPVRLVSGYLVVNAALFLALWLQALIPPVLTGEWPTFLEGTGLTTAPVQILDLGFTLPLMAVAAYLLVKRAPSGRILTGALLVMLAIETVSIAVDQLLGHAADPSSVAASAALTPVFAILTVVGIAVLALFLRPAPGRAAVRPVC